MALKIKNDISTIRYYVAMIGTDRTLAKDPGFTEATKMLLTSKEGKKAFDTFQSGHKSFFKLRYKEAAKMLDSLYSVVNTNMTHPMHISRGEADAKSIFLEHRLPRDLEYLNEVEKEIKTVLHNVQAQNKELNQRIDHYRTIIEKTRQQNVQLKQEVNNLVLHMHDELGYSNEKINQLKKGTTMSPSQGKTI